MSTSPETTITVTLHALDQRGVVRLVGRYATDPDDLWSAMTSPARLAVWYGTVAGDLRLGGDFTAQISISGWDGHGHVDGCHPARELRLTMWEEVGSETTVAAVLTPDGDHTTLAIEVRGVPLHVVWAYGVGWRMHAEILGTYLAGAEIAKSESRWDELEALYRDAPVVPLEH